MEMNSRNSYGTIKSVFLKTRSIFLIYSGSSISILRKFTGDKHIVNTEEKKEKKSSLYRDNYFRTKKTDCIKNIAYTILRFFHAL